MPTTEKTSQRKNQKDQVFHVPKILEKGAKAKKMLNFILEGRLI